MMTRTIAVLALMLLAAACGADGAPKAASEPGITISGQAQIGVVGGS